jgi:hypothetical protein
VDLGASTPEEIALSAGDIPQVGDWNGDGRTKVGIFQSGFWALDYNGSFNPRGTGTPIGRDPYIGLVHPPRAADAPSVAPPALFECWKVALNPPQNRGMGHGDPPIRHHDQIPQAQFEAGVPTHAQNDDLSVEVASFEHIFDRDEPLHLFIITGRSHVCTRAFLVMLLAGSVANGQH